MRLRKLVLKNFRGYNKKIVIDLGDLTTFVGRNDIGKSTILDALDIFFNDKKANSYVSKDDFNIHSTDRNILIGVLFDELPEKVTIDSEFETTFEDEFLLNEEGLLEIHKYYTGTSLSKICLNSNHPTHKDLKTLLNLKISDLKEKAEKLNITEEFNGTISSSIRGALRKSLFDGNLKIQQIVIYKTKIENNGAKEIWEKLQTYLPTYSLFQSDRKNEEKDNEVQSPMKEAIKQIVKHEKLQEKLNEIKETVRMAAQEIADLTISKLKEMNAEIANDLKSNFGDPKWESAFNFSITSDDNIPLNKRGSGVRRLILLNFFRAEAERRRKERKSPTIIYAFEEPETSQHPIHQKMLIDAFIELSEKQDTQIILTTHSPGIGKLLPVESLRLLTKKEADLIIYSHIDGDNIIEQIAKELGVLPTIEIININRVNTAICVEGYSDIEFLKNISQIPELQILVDFKKEERCILIFLGGSTLQFWVNKNYLKKLNLNEIHIYDSDSNATDEKNRFKYKKYTDKINRRGGFNAGYLTDKAEIENYIHPKLIENKYNISTFYGEANWQERWNLENPAKLISNEIKRLKDSGENIQLVSERTAKKELCELLSKEMSKDLLDELLGYDEIKKWFNKIKESIEN
jgi:putative ATP-dependent endonuclease of the OLD family